jgi:hypothetical protein
MLNTLAGIIASSGGAAAGGDFESIATVTVGSGGVSSITFSSIPSTYKHLQIRALTVTSTPSNGSAIQFNSDTTSSNYKYHSVYGTGSSASAGNGSPAYAPFFNGGAATTSPGSMVLDILDYSNTNKYTTIRSLDGYDANGSGYVGLTSGLWMNTAAISSIKFDAAYLQYSSFALYGIKG